MCDASSVPTPLHSSSTRQQQHIPECVLTLLHTLLSDTCEKEHKKEKKRIQFVPFDTLSLLHPRSWFCYQPHCRRHHCGHAERQKSKESEWIHAHGEHTRHREERDTDSRGAFMHHCFKKTHKTKEAKKWTQRITRRTHRERQWVEYSSDE